MRNWIKVWCFLCLITSLNAQSAFELSYDTSDGHSIGIDNNNLPSYELKKSGLTLGLQSSFLLTSIQENFYDLSIQKEFNVSKLRVIPRAAFVTNLIFDEKNIQNGFVDVGIVYQLNSLDLLVRPIYDLENNFDFSLGLKYGINEQLDLLLSYGANQRLVNLERQVDVAFQYQADKLLFRSGIEIPMVGDETFVRLMSSFRYTF